MNAQVCEEGAGQPRQFATTRWSLVLSAAKSQSGEEKARNALEELCRIYWRPRGRGRRDPVPVEPWSTLTAPFYGCQNLLETGDPVVGIGFAMGTNIYFQGPNPDGTQSADGYYHPEDEAFPPVVYAPRAKQHFRAHAEPVAKRRPLLADGRPQPVPELPRAGHGVQLVSKPRSARRNSVAVIAS